MFVSVLSVHAMTMNVPSRSDGPAYSRGSHVIEPSAASASSSGPASGETTVTSPPQASRPSVFSRPIAPPPITMHRRPFSFRQAM